MGQADVGCRGTAERVVIAVSVQALCQPVPKVEALEASRLDLRVEGTVSPEGVCEWLVDNGFERVDRIDLPGQFARRGGIVDVYAPLISGEAVRLPRRPQGTARNDKEMDSRLRGNDKGSVGPNDMGSVGQSGRGDAGRNDEEGICLVGGACARTDYVRLDQERPSVPGIPLRSVGVEIDQGYFNDINPTALRHALVTTEIITSYQNLIGK